MDWSEVRLPHGHITYALTRLELGSDRLNTATLPGHRLALPALGGTSCSASRTGPDRPGTRAAGAAGKALREATILRLFAVELGRTGAVPARHRSPAVQVNRGPLRELFAQAQAGSETHNVLNLTRAAAPRSTGSAFAGR
jgi:hypothetical protein